MKFIHIGMRHEAMFKVWELLPVILVIIMADVQVNGIQSVGEIKLEGNPSDYDVLIGSTVNITCRVVPTPSLSCSTMWYKNSKRLTEQTKYGRIQWVLGQLISNRCSLTKLIIRNFSSSDAGEYKCLAIKTILKFQTDSEDSSSSIHINAVPCYQGFYCPESERVPRRCPLGTFSPNKNAVSVKNCLPCPVEKNELKSWETMMEHKTIVKFQTNCKSSFKEKTSNLSASAKVAIIVISLTVTLLFVMGLLFAFYRRNAEIKYREKLLSPFKDVDYDPPKLPRSKDVFVCYSSKNREWVHEILFPKLKSQDFKVFIDFIDFEIGTTIDDNIVKGINGCRKTLFVLSKDSLKSLYARKELYHALAAGKTGHQVLVILYEKCRAPPEIADIVYLDWTDEINRVRFWERLYKAIKRPLPNESAHV